ncbi:hypothetical protein ACJJTC_009408 [Scirpophaga incertulas]
MFCPYKNSYLQLVVAMNPRVINKAVDEAMQVKNLDLHTEQPAAQRLESMQPSLFAPHVDITRAQLGFGRIGLRLLNRDLHSTDPLKQLQALHSLLDQVQISENAMFLIDLNVVYRLVDIMFHSDAVVREKVCLNLSHLASYYQGRLRILSKPDIVDNLMTLILKDRKEIRYAAAYTLRSLSRDRCACATMMENREIVENLLKVIRNDHTGIVILYLKILENLAEWNPVRALKANAFQIMMKLFENSDPRIVSIAMDCMSQLCRHHIGQILADENDLTFVLMSHLTSPSIDIIISAVGVMAWSTLTTRSKWRAKERCLELTNLLVILCDSNKPILQLRCMQVLINLCDCPDIRNHLERYRLKHISNVYIRTHEQWDGTSVTRNYEEETGHNYRTMCIEGVETVKNDYGDNELVINVHSYLQTVTDLKQQLIKAILWKSYKD